MASIETLLKEADFSRETDLKERLHQQLFGRKVISFPGSRMALSDDDLDLVNAAGDSDAAFSQSVSEKELQDIIDPKLPGKI